MCCGRGTERERLGLEGGLDACWMASGDTQKLMSPVCGGDSTGQCQIGGNEENFLPALRSWPDYGVNCTPGYFRVSLGGRLFMTRSGS